MAFEGPELGLDRGFNGVHSQMKWVRFVKGEGFYDMCFYLEYVTV